MSAPKSLSARAWAWVRSLFGGDGRPFIGDEMADQRGNNAGQ